MSSSNMMGMTWFKSGIATTTETSIANAPWDANNCRVRKVNVLNDGTTNDLLVRLHIGGAQITR